MIMLSESTAAIGVVPWIGVSLPGCGIRFVMRCLSSMLVIRYEESVARCRSFRSDFCHTADTGPGHLRPVCNGCRRRVDDAAFRPNRESVTAASQIQRSRIADVMHQ